MSKGETQLFTYVMPSQIKSSNPGYCFQKAGWTVTKTIPSGLVLLTKQKEQYPPQDSK